MRMTGTDYDLLEQQVASLFESERDLIANAANFSAFVFHELPLVNWAGFYFPDRGDLLLGPFGGKPACVRLAAGQGVCGAAFTSGTTVVVDDVNAFAGHIACDAASRSEIVLPLLVRGGVAGVFDIDSPVASRFTPRDRAGLERLVTRFVALTWFPDAYPWRPPAEPELARGVDVAGKPGVP
ncbi:GAF domain-containing protein [bacterium]|nr:MAG: GAF domain-containing protein [bacterium]